MLCTEILKKCQENFKTGGLKKFVLYFVNNLRKQLLGNWKM